MNRIKSFLHCYVCVMSCVTLATAVFITVFMPEVELGVDLLWQMMLVSFLCSIFSLLYPGKTISKKKMALLIALHYVEVHGVVLGFGFLFSWFSIEYLPHVIGMLILINGIFLLISAVEWSREKEIARQMNRRLAEYQRNMIQ